MKHGSFVLSIEYRVFPIIVPHLKPLSLILRFYSLLTNTVPKGVTLLLPAAEASIVPPHLFPVANAPA